MRSCNSQSLSLHLPTPTAPLALPPSPDTHHTLGSPSGRAGAKRLRGLTAPILPTSYPQIHCTDSLYETASHHPLSAHPSPPPFGRYLSRRERQELSANFKQLHRPKFFVRLWMIVVALALGLGEAVIKFMGAVSVVCLADSECKRGACEKF